MEKEVKGQKFPVGKVFQDTQLKVVGSNTVLHEEYGLKVDVVLSSLTQT